MDDPLSFWAQGFLNRQVSSVFTPSLTVQARPKYRVGSWVGLKTFSEQPMVVGLALLSVFLGFGELGLIDLQQGLQDRWKRWRP